MGDSRLKIEGITELANERDLSVGEWFEIRIRFRRNEDRSCDIVVLPTIMRLPQSEVDIMKQEGGLLS